MDLFASTESAYCLFCADEQASGTLRLVSTSFADSAYATKISEIEIGVRHHPWKLVGVTPGYPVFIVCKSFLKKIHIKKILKYMKNNEKLYYFNSFALVLILSVIRKSYFIGLWCFICFVGFG